MATVNDVRTSVITALDSHFPNIEIVGEEIAQGFQEPCFFVKLFPASHEQEFWNRYKRHHSFDIHYFSDSDYKNEDMHEMAEQLFQKLEYIEVNGYKTRGTKMNYEIVDGVLHFFVDYDFHIHKVEELDEMEELTINTDVKE